MWNSILVFFGFVPKTTRLSVNDAIAPLLTMVNDLSTVSSECAEVVADNLDRIRELEEENKAENAERDRATALTAKLQEVLGMTGEATDASN